MPDLDLSRKENCKTCGEQFPESEIVRCHADGKVFWEGCAVCFNVAFRLQKSLPWIISSAIEAALQCDPKINNPTTTAAAASRAVSERLRELRMGARDLLNRKSS